MLQSATARPASRFFGYGLAKKNAPLFGHFSSKRDYSFLILTVTKNRKSKFQVL
jgi:hypothetical protein